MAVRCLLLAGVGSLLLDLQMASGSATKQFEKLGEVLCTHGLRVSPRELTTRFGIYEAQVSGRLYKKVNGKTFDDAFVSQQTKDLAVKAKHLSFGWGRCSNGDAWSVSAPSPNLEISINRDTLNYNAHTAAKVCKRIEAEFAPANAPDLIKVETKISADKKTASISTHAFKDGLMSLTCTLSATHVQSGNVLWYLIPVGSVSEVPFATPSQTSNTKKQLTTWVQKVRAEYKRSKLKPAAPSLVEAAKQLAQTQSISHDVTTLNDIATELAKQKIDLIGEDRVIGSSIDDMQWLLWYSPSHRSLLLNPYANHMAVNVQKLNGLEELAILIFTK